MTTAETRDGHAVFETRLGWIGIGWSAKGVTHLQLPEGDRDRTESRLLARGARQDARTPPAAIQAAIDAIVRYAAGEAADFSEIPVDLTGVDEFRRAIYDRARKLAYGETTTYGGLADAAGHPGLARETGAAMGSNPIPIIVPCHRVLAAGGKMGGFSAPGGVFTKRRLLELEHAKPPSPLGQSAFDF
jgi:methylated-DNA-[protein]-cysteine S-methyltransferase